MSERRIVELGDVADLTVGHVGSMAAQYEPSGVPFLRSQNVLPHVIDLSDVKYIGKGFDARLSKSALRPGDVVTVRTGKPGVTAVVPAWLEVANCSDLVITRPGPLLDARWFSYYMNSAAAGWIDSQLVGAVQQHFNVGSAKKLRLPLPPIHEQRAIAEVLGALDDKIAANIKLANTSRRLSQNLYQQALLENSVTHKVAELATLVSRGVAPKYTEDADSIIVLNQKCIRAQRVHLEPARRTQAQKFSVDKTLQPEDVLVNSTGQGTLGRVARWIRTEVATVDSHVSIVRFHENRVDQTCAGFAMLAAEGLIEALGEGSTGQTELSRSSLNEFSIRLPQRELQKALGVRLREFSMLESSVLAENRTLAGTRDALLPRLMSGKLRVKDAESFVADAM